MSGEFPRDFGGYTLERKLAKGGMAWVFLGHEKPPLDRPVAIKVPFPHLTENPDFVERFKREARTTAKMQHPNIVQIHAYGEEDDIPFIAMEYVDGWDLKTWLAERHHPLPLEVALIVSRDMCLALEHAHTPGREVIHRDLKPSNVMLTREGLVKLMDFGLARAMHDHSLSTVDGAILGTYAYMSPEQSRGMKLEAAAGRQSDIFSAGVVCFELIRGERLFPGEDPAVLIAAIQSVIPRPLDEFDPTVPPRVARAVAQMLEKDPARRCSDIGVVAREMDAALEDLQVRGAREVLREYVRDPESTAERLRKERIEKCLERALRPERQAEAPGECLLELRRVLHMDPKNRVALDHRAAVERRIRDGAASDGDEKRATAGVPKPPARRPLPSPVQRALWALGVVAAVATAWLAGFRPSPVVDGKKPGDVTTVTPDTPSDGNAGTTSNPGQVTVPQSPPSPPPAPPPFEAVYEVFVRPGFAYVYVDDAEEPGEPLPSFPVTLREGRHRFRLVNVESGIDVTLTYDVHRGDPYKKLFLDASGYIEPR